MKLIIYLPALNEAADIQQVIATLPRQLEKIDTIQYLVIDDGSSDDTASLAQDSGAQVICHSRNRGVGAAFHTAIQYALENQADILVGIDADNQFDSGDIPGMIEPIIEKQADMVIGNRFTNGIPEHMPRANYWGNKRLTQMVSSVSGLKFQDVSCGFRAYSREALFRLNIFAEFTYTHETILSLVFQGRRIVECPVRIRYSADRRSRVAGSISHYAFQVSKIILRVLLDYRPLRVFGSIGAVFIFLGMCFELFLFGYYAINHDFTPYKATGFIGLGLIVFGMLVLLIALIADMFNRLRLNQDKLLYEVKKNRYEK